MKTIVSSVLLTLLAIAAAMAAVAYSGVINVAADSPHMPIVEAFLETTRERSVEAQSRGIEVPDLQSAALIRGGAGNYAAMCAGCHRAPGMDETELSRGLSPTPPNLAEHGVREPAEAFWVIKHGIQSTGMPAWGESMADDYIWGMVAFLQELPSLDAQQYQTLVDASGGHQHGGGGENHGAGADHHDGESQSAGVDHHDGDSHGDAGEAHAHGQEPAGHSNDDDLHASAPLSQKRQPAAGETHLHADGKPHTH